MADYTGTPGNDVFDGTPGADTADGAGGDDRLSGAGGADTLRGGEGDDVLDGGSDGDTLYGEGGNDVLDPGPPPPGSGYYYWPHTLYGGPGDDRYVLRHWADIVELPGEGTDTMERDSSFTLPENVEIGIMSGTYGGTLAGNNAANILIGNAGNNSLNGSGGADRMIGGGGDDEYFVDHAGDVIVEYAGGGNDYVRSTYSYSLVGTEIEGLMLLASAASGIGNDYDNRIWGNGASNLLRGLGGNDKLDGGGGADVMEGGTGDDEYHLDDPGDQVVELAGEGYDAVQTYFSFDASAIEVERIFSYGSGVTLIGNDRDNWLRGIGSGNRVEGGAGNDRLEVYGNGTAIGGTGDDIYRVHTSDQVIENPGEGYDTIVTTLNYSLMGLAVEALILTGHHQADGYGNDEANRLTGSSVANALVGNGGNDVLDGGGGNDTLIGGTGDDWYIVEGGNDKVTEKAGEGYDTVESPRNFSIAGTAVEALVLTGRHATDAIGNELGNALTGNDGANALIGNGGDDVLDGRGGNDTLVGGLGDDWYIVEGSNDIVAEKAGEGTDTIQSMRNVNLTAMAAVENVVLSGPHLIDAVGNALANALTGNDAANGIVGNGGDDLLNGRGGSDTLIGGAGLDSFVFDSALGAGNIDSITDFAVADDTIRLDRTIFAGLAADGALAAGAFRVGTTAVDADDRILYDAATGRLWYDADGVGGVAAAQFAKLTAGLALTSADFFAVP